MRSVGKRFLSSVLALLLVFAAAIPVAADSDGRNAQSRRTVRISCGINNALYLDDSGKPAGSCAEYVQQLAWVNHWDLEYVEGSWNESVRNLYDGSIDILFPTQKTREREEKMGFSSYIGGYQPIGLFARKDSDIYYDDFKAFDHKKIALSKGTSNETILKECAQQHAFTYTAVSIDSMQGKLDALQDGSVDLVLFSTLNDVPDGKVVSILDYLPFYFCTNIENEQLLHQLNNGMRTIMVNSPNITTTMFDEVMKGSNMTAFTKEESEVIATTDQVRVGVYAESLPLSGADASGNPAGIYVDLLKEIQEKSGIPIEIVLVPRKDFLYAHLDDGSVDFVLGSRNLPYAADDVSQYRVSESIMDYVTVATTKAGYQFEQDCSPKFVLTHARKYLEDDVYKAYPQASIVYVDSVKECLAAVQEEWADVTLLNTWEFNYQSKNPRFSDLIEWESMRRQCPLVLGTRKDTDFILLSIMEKAIDQIAGQDKDSIVATNLNMPYSSYNIVDYFYIMKNTLIACACVLLVFVVIFLMYMKIRKRYVHELQAKNDQLKQANEAKNNFMSRMSHELRTPLNAIAGYTTELQQSAAAHELDEKLADHNLAAIQKAYRYQLAIIGDLLDIQKIESGELELVKEEVDAEQYMENIVNMIRPEAEKKNIRFTYERLSMVNDTYLIDGVRFQQILTNVLHNAVKFTPTGGSVKLTAQATACGEKTNTLKFVISDTGIGMSQAFVENQLFHKFAQEYHGNTSPYEGCGIGLAISRKLLEEMGGEITCRSEQGKGSIFTIVLTAEHLDKKKKERGHQELFSRDLCGVNVLLCEDNAMNVDIEKRLLKRLGCQVDTAHDGRIGCDAFRNSTVGYYTVILMDIRMPEMDGLEAARTIRAMNRPDAKTIPIIAVSANAFDDDVRRSLAAGMNAHLAKPVDVKTLHETIRLYCKGKTSGAARGKEDGNNE